MNRLILIGNGFDLAHGLPTTYNDFILWYLQKVFATAIAHNGYKDNLIDISMEFNYKELSDRHNVTLKDFIDHYYKIGFKEVIDSLELRNLRKGLIVTNPFNVTMVPFLKNLVTNCNSKNWVDIENEYYDALKQLLDLIKEQQRQALYELNHAMETLIDELRLYFKSLEKPKVSRAIQDIFSAPIRERELANSQNLTHKEYKPKATHILSFNYTETANIYANSAFLDLEGVELNYIHGEAFDHSNSLIFGFGDELDSKYAELELSRINEYFTFIKSFGYLKTKNYHSMLRFINSDKYQVFILGHSCGLSDRTMLNMLFKHDNCQSIKIYYHQNAKGNNFTELTQEISRHFKNKEMLREKVVNFEFCEPLPQMVH